MNTCLFQPRRRPFSLVLNLAAIFLLAACSSSPFQPLPDEPEVCLVPLVEEADAAAPWHTEIELLEIYYDQESGEEAPQEKSERRFYSGNELQAILEGKDFTVFSFSGNLRQETTGIIDNLDAGRPLLLLLEEKSAGTFWVFVVGYGKDGDYLVVQRPDLSVRALETRQILPWWDVNEQLTLLAVPSQLVGE